MEKFLKRLKGVMSPRSVSGVAITALIIAVVVALNATVYALTNAFGLYLYSPQRDDLTISTHTDELFSDAVSRERKVRVIFCLDEDSLEMHPTGAYVLDTARQFERRYPSLISLEFVNVITRLDEDGNFFDFNKYVDDKTALRDCSIIFESETSHRVLTDAYTQTGFADFFSLDSSNNVNAYIGEEVFASMVSWVLQTEHKKSYLTQNHGEQVEISFANMLSCAGYELDMINLKQANKIPDDCDLLIISNPTSDFQRRGENSNIYTEIDRLNDYVKRGGDIYVSIDPYAKRLDALEDFLSEHGITVAGKENELGIYAREIVKDNVNGVSTDGFTLIAALNENDALTKKINDRIEKYGDATVITRDTARLNLSGNARAMLLSSSASVTEAQGKTVSTDGSFAIAAYTTVDNDADKKDAHIFVIPSAYFTITDAIINDSYSNRDFLYLMLNELMGSNTAPYGCNIISYDQSRLEGLTMKSANLYTALLIAIPCAIAISGFIVIRRRKNR